jgi:uncharacterized protein (TIGR02145 family)
MKTIFFNFGVIILCTSMGLMSCSKEHPAATGPLSSKSVTTLAPEKITTTTAYIRGMFKTSEPGNIIENGIYLTELNKDFILDPSQISGLMGKKYSGVSEGNGNFFVSLTNLKPDTRYGYVAFATNLSGTIYGKMQILVTSYGTVKDLEGNQYQTVRIADQIWMRENLKSEYYSDQTSIVGHYSSENDGIYGKHYSWNAANHISAGAKSGTIQGACPTGWHVPSDGEWQKLLSFVGIPLNDLNSLNLIGDMQAVLLKDGGSNYWTNDKVNNGTGFSVLPAGIVKKCDDDMFSQAAFWTSTPNIFYGFQNESEKIVRRNHPNCTCGISVRCIKN